MRRTPHDGRPTAPPILSRGTDIVTTEEQVMGLYGERVLPRIVNVACGTKSVAPLRRRVCEGQAGRRRRDRLRLGAQQRLVPGGRHPGHRGRAHRRQQKLAASACRRSSVPVQRSALDGQSLPFPDDSYDAACPPGRCAPSPTSPPPWVNCGASSSPAGPCTSSSTGWPPTSGSAAGNERLEPMQKRVFGGCHLSRQIVDMLTTAWLHHTERRLLREGPPKCGGADSLGIALSP